MGLHAFPEGPEHCAVYRRLAGGPPPLFGIEGGWNMPAARHRAVLSGDRPFRGVDHYVLTYHIGGAAVRRVDRPSFDRVARKGAISLQAPGSGGSFESGGRVEYGHLYFRQSLLCEIGDSLGLGVVAELDDFFALRDAACAEDISTYLRRAADRGDPPTAIEMDSRAYLIGLGLLRVVRYRLALVAAAGGDRARPPLARALELVEDRLGEPLRLSDLADAVGFSPFHFARRFKAEFGTAPAQYVMRRRTERAIELIRGSGGSLAEIAYRTGFASQAHMTRRVKALTGRTPGALR
ncbi:MAG: AraC family transcriptional regulator, partial [Geminicoccaceae bacterium]